VLFKQSFVAGIREGRITRTYRTWSRPQAAAGRSQRTPAGLIAIERVQRVATASITDADAQAAGSADRRELLGWLGNPPPAEVWRVDFRYLGEPPQRGAGLTADKIRTRLARLDAAGAIGPWTAATLRLIRDHPARRAGDLADMAGRERLEFKADVRKLKALGLTESLLVGYRLTPAGEETLRAIESG
jgi:hypothetical protein